MSIYNKILVIDWSMKWNIYKKNHLLSLTSLDNLWISLFSSLDFSVSSYSSQPKSLLCFQHFSLRNSSTSSLKLILTCSIAYFLRNQSIPELILYYQRRLGSHLIFLCLDRVPSSMIIQLPRSNSLIPKSDASVLGNRRVRVRKDFCNSNAVNALVTNSTWVTFQLCRWSLSNSRWRNAENRDGERYTSE